MVPWAVRLRQNASYYTQFASEKMCALREMLALEEENDLSEIKLDFGFFCCLLSQRGNREAPLPFLGDSISSKPRSWEVGLGNSI